MADDENGAGTPTTLEWYVNALSDDVAYAAESAADAEELVHGMIGGTSNPYQVPPRSLARAILEVGADLYYRKASRNGVVGIDGIEAQPFRINRDPLVAAYPFLRPFLVFGI